MYALQIENLYKSYANGFEALKGINLKVKSGDFFALLGANGAGKSTTIGIISGLISKTSGSVIINGHNLDTHPGLAKNFLGLVPQEINLNLFETCTEILINQAGYYGISRRHAMLTTEKLLKQLGLYEKRKSLVRHLSGGLKRRLMIARALVHNPKLLILDEPTAGVDIEIRHDVWRFLIDANKKGTTIILTTHYLEEAEYLCKNIAIIDHGKIIEDTSMKDLLRTIHFQTFILNTVHPIENLPNLEPFFVSKIDNFSFELRMDAKWSLNDLFSLLNEKGILIHSMRNKTNRLEELFMNRIKYEK